MTTTHAKVHGVELNDLAIAGADRAKLWHLIEQHGLDATLMTLSEYCGSRADSLPLNNTAGRRRYAELEGAIGALVPAAFRL